MAVVGIIADAPRNSSARFESNPATRDAGWVKAVILTLSLGFFAIFLLMPLVAVFYEALRKRLVRLSRRAHRTGCIVRDPADAHHRRSRRSVQPRFWRCCGVGPLRNSSFAVSNC